MRKLNCIMLIDDDEDDNFFHQIVINQEGATDKVVVAINAFEALDYLKSGKEIPELIFLDINMPKMNGWEFLDEYGKLDVDRKAKVVIIMLTTSLNPADEKKAAEMPVISGFKNKPLTGEMLHEIMDLFFPDTEKA